MWNKSLLVTWDVGQLFVISAPAGTGKTTIVQKLVERFPNVAVAISATTRPQRADEENGREYFFLTEEEFLRKKQEGAFLETVELYGFLYGTLRDHVMQLRAMHKHVILVIDVQGARRVRELFHGVLIFMKPPSMDELRRRLEGRRSENELSLHKRIERAKEEVLEEAHFDYSVVNDDKEVTVDSISAIMIAESYRIQQEKV